MGTGLKHFFFIFQDGTRVLVWDDSSELSESLNNRLLPETIRLTVPITGAAAADVQIQVPRGYQNLRNIPLLVYV